jgi:hypothetical protein
MVSKSARAQNFRFSQKARRRRKLRKSVGGSTSLCHSAHAPAMVARRTSRGGDTGVAAGDAAGKSGGALSVAERRVAKQRERRQKKTVAKTNVVDPPRGGLKATASTPRGGAGSARVLQTVGTEKPDGSRAVTNSEDDAYVGMFLDEGDVTTDDESDGGDEDDAKNANPAQEKQPINLEMDWHDGSDISKEYLGMFLDEGDAGDEKDGDGDDDGESDDAASEDLENAGSEKTGKENTVVAKSGSFGNYGRSDGRMSVEDDEWATSAVSWTALSPYLKKYHDKKVWMPFYYDGEAGVRLKSVGFNKVVHKKEDFFKRVNDAKFCESIKCVIDNPPYTGSGMKERILTALVKQNVPFCLLLPIGVLHGAAVRKILDATKTQVLIPRRVFVAKKGKPDVPFKHLVWLCHGMGLGRDLELMPDI